MSTPAWSDALDGNGLYSLAREVDGQKFYKLLHVLLECAYNDGRLSVYEEAFAKEQAKDSRANP